MPGTKREAHRFVMSNAKQGKAAAPTPDLRKSMKSMKPRSSLDLQKSSEESAEVQAMAQMIMDMKEGKGGKKGGKPPTAPKVTATDVAASPTLASTSHCCNEGCGVADSPDKKLKLCARCNSVAYCSAECQKLDWKARHKKSCSK